MSEISKFFDSLATGNKWKAGVAFTRTGALPLDDSSVFASVTAATEYASTGGNSYPGQFITVVTETEAIAYVVTPTKTLQRLASTAIEGDVDSALVQLSNKITTLEIELPKKEVKLVDSDTVTIDRTDATAPKANVNVSTKEGNSLSVDEENGGLYVAVPEIDVPEYNLVVAETPTTGYAKTYELQKDGVAIGAKIDIPKDMVVSSGAVETYTEDTIPADSGITAGTYIVLVIANKAKDKLYIPVADLIEYVTSGSATDDAVQIAVSADHKVSASIKDGSIVTAMIGDGQITTDKISDKNITKDKLDDDVQASISKIENVKSDLDSAADDDLVTALAVKNAVANVEVPQHGEINADATNDTWAGSKDVYDMLTITRVTG